MLLKNSFPADISSICFGMDIFDVFLDKIKSSSNTSSAIVFYLKVIKKSRMAFHERMAKYFLSELLDHLIPASDVFLKVQALSVLGVTEYVRKDLIYKLEDFENIVRVAQDKRINVLGLWGSDEIAGRHTVDMCLTQNRYKLLLALKYGSRSVYSVAEFERLRLHMKIVPDGVPKNVIFRCYQVVILYTIRFLVMPFRQSINATRETSLVHLWNSMQDPYLLKQDFDSFENHKFTSAWIWYRKLVLGNSCCTSRTPRSLLHLSRCAVRQQLALNFQCPRGIEQLRVPEFLKRYLSCLDS